MAISNRKNILFSIVLVFMVACIIEIMSFTFFSVRKDYFSFSNLNEFVLNDIEIERVKKSFDYNLGWKTEFSTRFGERPSEGQYKEALISSFGDSYTFCDEVRDNETWQTYLSNLLKKDVLNFGNGAYGVDQSYLRFKEDYKNVKTEVVTLGLITENINRIINVYRKFYLSSTGIPATKPRFYLENNRLVLIENPVKSINEVERLKDEDFVADIGKNDFWFNITKKPHFSFPYSVLFLNKNIWHEIKHGKQGDKINKDDLLNNNLWEDDKAQNLLFAIFDNFVTDVENNNAIPVILLFPLEVEVAYKIKTKKNPPGIEAILGYCNRKGYNVYCPINELVGEAIFRGNYDLYAEGGHYSANGNKTLAKYFFQYFQKTLYDQ